MDATHCGPASSVDTATGKTTHDSRDAANRQTNTVPVTASVGALCEFDVWSFLGLRCIPPWERNNIFALEANVEAEGAALHHLDLDADKDFDRRFGAKGK